MNPRSFHFPKSAPHLLAAALWCVPLASACSGDDAPPLPPTTYGVQVATLDGQTPDAAVELRCDRGGPDRATVDADDAAASPGFFSTLVVAVTTTPTDLATRFVLRPAHACGSATRCGYVRIEGLDASGNVLTSVDTSTNEGVLQLDLAQLPTLLRVSLIRGLDQKTLQNPDKTDVTTSVAPNFVVPDCAASPSGGGAGGAGGRGSAGESSAGADNAAGADTTAGGAAGAAGNGNGNEPGGAAGADTASSGAGGA